MKKIIFLLLIFVFNIIPANASEITGKISTNPSDPGRHYAFPLEADGSQGQAQEDEQNGGLAVILKDRHDFKAEEDKSPDREKEEKIEVLGAAYYPDGSLLRGSDKKIYLISQGYKKHIANLGELKRYTGQEIIDVDFSQLEEYEARPHLDKELIRQIGGDKVYVIEQCGKRHIKSLEELRVHYFGLEIFNLKPEEMKLYD
ncbi:MAG: hypothetical protein U9R06_02510 [Patescibacteria group bacterium]|nr:hypothetical protein [Patescibacteria group bacterium]